MRPVSLNGKQTVDRSKWAHNPGLLEWTEVADRWRKHALSHSVIYLCALPVIYFYIFLPTC